MSLSHAQADDALVSVSGFVALLCITILLFSVPLFLARWLPYDIIYMYSRVTAARITQLAPLRELLAILYGS